MQMSERMHKKVNNSRIVHDPRLLGQQEYTPNYDTMYSTTNLRQPLH